MKLLEVTLNTATLLEVTLNPAKLLLEVTSCVGSNFGRRFLWVTRVTKFE